MFGKSDDSKDSKNSSGDTKSGSPPTSKLSRRESKSSKLLAAAKSTFSSSSSSDKADKDDAQKEAQKNSFRVVQKEEENTIAGNSAGESKPGPRSTFRVGVTEDRNKKCRRTMEDTHSYIYNFLAPPPNSGASSTKSGSTTTLADTESVDTDNGYFAIFDGHAGTYAADWCGRRLHHVLEETIRKHPNHPIPELLDMTFTNCDSQLEKLPVKNSGCTAVCAVLRWEDRVVGSDANSNRNSIVSTSGTPSEAVKQSPRTERQRILYTANVGDARIVLCRNGKALRLSYDHKGSDENEGKRVANAGGLILNNRVNGVLAVTRALGDSYMKELVTGHPYTTESILQPDCDEFIILACDGLWDVCSDQEACELIRNVYDPQEASKILVDYALSRFSSDNLSCMVVRLDFTAKFEKLNKDAEGQSISESIPESIEPAAPAEKSAGESTESPAVEKTIPVVPSETPKVPDLKMPEPEKIHQKENAEPVPAEGAREVVQHMKEDVKKAEEKKAEEKKADEKKAEEKKAEEKKAEEKKAGETKAEEKRAEGKKQEKPKEEVKKTEAIKQEKPKESDSRSDMPKKD